MTKGEHSNANMPRMVREKKSHVFVHVNKSLHERLKRCPTMCARVFERMIK